MTAVIRPRRSDDLDALADVLVRVHALDGYPVEGVEHPRAWLTPARQLAAWTALVSNTPVGHIALVKANRDDAAAAMWLRSEAAGELDSVAIPVRLFVDPAYRGLGAAKQLMATVSEYAHAHGLVLVLDVMLKDQAAIHLYETLGYRRLGTIDHRHDDGLVEPAAIYLAPAAGPRRPGPGGGEDPSRQLQRQARLVRHRTPRPPARLSLTTPATVP
jgi:GNAT superfamily N-acetyltransferase